jgi:hypothetical protein
MLLKQKALKQNIAPTNVTAERSCNEFNNFRDRLIQGNIQIAQSHLENSATHYTKLKTLYHFMQKAIEPNLSIQSPFL